MSVPTFRCIWASRCNEDFEHPRPELALLGTDMVDDTPEVLACDWRGESLQHPMKQMRLSWAHGAVRDTFLLRKCVLQDLMVYFRLGVCLEAEVLLGPVACVSERLGFCEVVWGRTIS